MRQFLNSVLLPSSANTAFVWDSLNSDVDLESLLIRDRFPDARASQGLIIALYLPGFFPLQFLGGDRGSCILGYFSPCSCSVPFVVSTNLGVARRVLCSWGRSCKEDRLPSFFGVFFHLWQVLLEGRAWRMECIVLMEVGPSKWNFNIVQWCKINHCASRVTVDGTQVNEKTVGTQATLKSLPVTASSKKIQPLWIRETPDTSSSTITASREQQRAPTTFVKDPSMTSFAASISIHFLSSTGMNILEGGYDGGLGCPFCSVAIGFPDAGFPSHLFVTRRFSFLCVDFFHVVVRSSGDHNPWEGSGILHGSHLNFDSKLFRRKCDHDLNHWADLCKSADPLHWLRTITVSE